MAGERSVHMLDRRMSSAREPMLLWVASNKLAEHTLVTLPSKMRPVTLKEVISKTLSRFNKAQRRCILDRIRRHWAGISLLRQDILLREVYQV